MKVVKKNVYYCGYCKTKHYLHSYHCKQHEEKCDRNPKNQSVCFSCMHLTNRETEVVSGQMYDGSENITPKTLLFCEHHKTFLYPRKYHNGWDTVGEYDNIKMPSNCNDFAIDPPF